MERKQLLRAMRLRFEISPVLCLLGPRQSGKTTLARDYLSELDDQPKANYFDLEDPVHVARLEQPMLALQGLEGLVVIDEIVDEIQRVPELFQILRVLVDRSPPAKARFLILGSASRDLIRQSSETLAGRISFIEVQPFALTEVGTELSSQLWLRGGFPRAFLAPRDAACAQWRNDYVRTFLERDIPALGISIPAPTLRRFWLMLTHLHGQVFNASELASSMGVSAPTIQRYLDILVGTFMIRRLQPWHENLSKRQLKRPKIYFRDSGIFHQLLGVTSEDELLTHPKLGASWEGFALEEVIRATAAEEEDVYCWGVHQQAELDLVILRGPRKYGYEFKYGDAPKITRSMRQSVELLDLEELTVVCPSNADYVAADRIRVSNLSAIVAKQADSCS